MTIHSTRPGSETRMPVTTVTDGKRTERVDRVVTEEPLEMRVAISGRSRTVAVTMRTPGADFELAAGFLHSEGVIDRRTQIVGISYCQDMNLPEEQLYNIVIVELDASAQPDLRPLERHFFTSSACGVCGKASLETIALRGVEPIVGDLQVRSDVIASLPDKLMQRQGLFESTGGLHAAGVFDVAGSLVEVREDVGRHNAVDKLVGWGLLNDHLPLVDRIVMVSGRSSFEIMQKCLVARAPVVCSVSAPSSLAVDVAREFGMTLIGFVRGSRFNVYAGAERVTT